MQLTNHKTGEIGERRGPNYAIFGGGTNSFETPPVAILVMPRPLGGTITRSANYLIAQIAGMRWRDEKIPPGENGVRHCPSFLSTYEYLPRFEDWKFEDVNDKYSVSSFKRWLASFTREVF